MTAPARRTLDRMTCPTCGRDVAARTVRGPRVNAGRPIPALRLPVRHHREHWEDGKLVIGRGWCPAGEGRRP